MSKENNVVTMKSVKCKEAPLVESTPFKVWKDEEGNNKIILDPEYAKGDVVKQITGTKDKEIAGNIFYTAVMAISPILPKEERASDNMDQCFNIIAQSLHDFQPKDATEARLLTQAVALYHHGMNRLAKAGSAELITHSEAQVNMAVKLFRVCNETIEALYRCRRGGEQKITVSHAVLTNQAIVNNFQGVGVPPEKEEIPHVSNVRSESKNQSRQTMLSTSHG